jgi:hypothetical protein
MLCCNAPRLARDNIYLPICLNHAAHDLVRVTLVVDALID